MIRELTTHLWQSTGFAIVAGLMTLAFRRNAAKVRFALWLSASLKFFVPFTLLMSLGGHLGWTPAPRSIALPQVSFVMERIAAPFSVPLSSIPQAPPTADWIGFAIAGVWIGGFAAILLMRVRSWRRIRAAIGISTPVAIPSPVEIRTSPGLLEPGVVGLVRPVLLLPDGIVDRLTPPQLEAVLAHELCHVRRRDNLFAAIHMIVEAVYWFHPMVWWIGARLVEERERACDEAVLTLGSEPRTYADAILNVCKHYVQSPLVCVAGVTGADLKRRIEAILTNRTGKGLNYAKKLLLASAGVAALAGPIAVGVVIGIGHVPTVRAQSQSTVPAIEQVAQAIPAAPAGRPAPVTAAPQNPAPVPGRRLLAMLFDFDTMTAEEQARVRQASLRWVQANMKPADSVAVLFEENGRLRVVQDFSNDRAALEAAIGMQTTGGGPNPVPGLRTSTIESAAQLFAALPEKKALLYYSSGSGRAGGDDGPDVRQAIEAAQKANMAIYAIDARGIAPSVPLAAGSVQDDEYNRRLEYARTKFGSPTSPMSRTYIQHGPPESIDDGGPNAPQVWHYGYLENFRSKVDYEFAPGNRHSGVRILWPPPLGTYEGVPAGAAALAKNQFGIPSRADSIGARTATGLPGRHSSFQTYPSGEWQSLVVPLDSLSGKVDLLGQIKTRALGGMASRNVANVQDNVEAASGTARVTFFLATGSYTCDVVLKERDSGKLYAETIDFEVK